MWQRCTYSYSYATSTHLAAGAASCGSGGRVLDAGRGARVGDPGSTPLHQPQGPGAYRIDPGIVTVRCVWIRGSCRLDPQGRRSGVRSPGAEGERRCGRAGGGGTGVRSPPVVVEPGFAHPGQRVSGGAAGLVVVEPGIDDSRGSTIPGSRQHRKPARLTGIVRVRRRESSRSGPTPQPGSLGLQATFHVRSPRVATRSMVPPSAET